MADWFDSIKSLIKNTHVLATLESRIRSFEERIAGLKETNTDLIPRVTFSPLLANFYYPNDAFLQVERSISTKDDFASSIRRRKSEPNKRVIVFWHNNNAYVEIIKWLPNENGRSEDSYSIMGSTNIRGYRITFHTKGTAQDEVESLFSRALVWYVSLMRANGYGLNEIEKGEIVTRER